MMSILTRFRFISWLHRIGLGIGWDGNYRPVDVYAD